jgi:glycosyltransferase involved in cell wall biosynthesis
MKHLIISREYPPAPYPPGGIGTYIANIARLMADQGETVHLIAQRWEGAPNAREVAHDGRLVIHRIGQNDLPPTDRAGQAPRLLCELEGLKKTVFPNQWFGWHAALLAEKLIEDGDVDVVEGQEWEAPLYFLLLRRALGLGPRRAPPCIVHLHCPTEFARRFNGALATYPEYPVMKRMEDFCIHAADALLCPSHYLARQCRQHYALPAERIKVIHLPVGFTPVLERDPQIWAHGSICYVGRIEPRKGVVEWLEAAARIARDDPTVHFDMVGHDIWGLQATLVERLPKPLLPRFRFHGSKPRAELAPFLAGARAAVVPSRWENFPNVCVEAMSSGLPVIATRLGGMVELVEDGRTGWLAPDTGIAGMVDGLADALRRCLAASPEQRAAMGRAAAEAVRRTCDNERTVAEHIAFRAEVGRLGAQRSLALSGLPRSRSGASLAEVGRAPSGSGQGAGIVVRVDRLAHAQPVLGSIRAQTTPPRAVTVVSAGPLGGEEVIDAQLKDENATVLIEPGRVGADAWNAGLASSPRTGECGYWLFLDQHDRLMPDCLEQIELVLSRRPEVGIVSFWTERTGSELLEAPPCPDLPYQLTDNDVTGASAFRAEAIGQRSPFQPGMPRGYDTWDIANMIMAKGWSAVTSPGLLARRHAERPTIPLPEATALRAMRGELLRHFSGTLTPDMVHLIDAYVPLPLAARQKVPAPRQMLHETLLRYLVTILLHPRRAARAIARRSRAPLAHVWPGARLRSKGLAP